MISQIFILSPRGDVIVCREFRGDVIRATPELFFRRVKAWKENNKASLSSEAPPIFALDGITYLYVKTSGLYIVATTKVNVSPSFVLELLNRLTRVFKDYCGVLNEESVRKNFVLVYELLDEVVDFGYPQGTSTELLKSYIFNEPVVVTESASLLANLKLTSQKTVPSSAVNKPISWSGDHKSTRKNEIFVDILERVSVLFDNTGKVTNSSIDGAIQMKSYLSGNPDLRMGLNEDLLIGRNSGGYGSVTLDDCNFHECVRLDHFDHERTLEFTPPDGEFVVMNYRIAGEFRVPFRIFPIIDESLATSKIEVLIKVRADIPEANYAGNFVLRLPVPKSTVSCTGELPPGIPGVSSEYKPNDKVWTWTIKKFAGGSEQTARVKIILGAGAPANAKKELGPISVEWEIPMHNCSGLQVRFLRIADKTKTYTPYRWVRYITSTADYVQRL